ncbi:hypothetical protein LTR95_007469 [Oleoguttula sp. CCFEE 5521]
MPALSSTAELELNVPAISEPDDVSVYTRSHAKVRPGGEDKDHLHPDYRLRRHDFFKPGRVFSTLWSQPAGHTAISADNENPCLSKTVHGDYIHTKVRRFVVIRQGTHSAWYLPITTYNGRGVAKPDVIKSDHCIVHTEEQTPLPSPAEKSAGTEESMQATAIRVLPDSHANTLDKLSCLDYGKVYTIEHNIKVKSIGNMHPESLPSVKAQFGSTFLRSLEDGTTSDASAIEHNQTPNPRSAGATAEHSTTASSFRGRQDIHKSVEEPDSGHTGPGEKLNSGDELDPHHNGTRLTEIQAPHSHRTGGHRTAASFADSVRLATMVSHSHRNAQRSNDGSD